MGIITTTSGATSVSISGAVSTTVPTYSATQTPVTICNTGGKSGQALTAGTGVLLYTVTAGKDFYVTSINIGYTAVTYELRDGTTIAGAVKSVFTCATPAVGGWITMTFPTPVKFDTGLFLDASVNCNIWYTISGYEQ